MNTPLRARALRLVSIVALFAPAATGCATASVHTARNTLASAPAGRSATLPKPDGENATPTPEPALARRTHAQRATPPQEFLTGSARRARLEQIVHRSRVVDGCWTAALRREPSHAAERVSVRLDVSDQGRASAAIDGTRDARLAECLRLRFVSQNFGAGEPMVFEAVFGLAQGG